MRVKFQTSMQIEVLLKLINQLVILEFGGWVLFETINTLNNDKKYSIVKLLSNRRILKDSLQ